MESTLGCTAASLLLVLFSVHSFTSGHVIHKRFAVDTGVSALQSDDLSSSSSNTFDDLLSNDYDKRGGGSGRAYDDYLDYASLKRFSSGFRNDLGKRGSSFRADLGKRSSFRYDLGKRSFGESIPSEEYMMAVPIDMLENYGYEPEKRASFRADLGKRAEYVPMDNESEAELIESLLNLDDTEKRASFRYDLGKRMFRSDLGKRYFRADLGKRAGFRADLGKRAPFRSDLGKRGGFRGIDLGKRSNFSAHLGENSVAS